MVKAYNKALHSDKIKLHRYAMQFYLPVSLGVRYSMTPQEIFSTFKDHTTVKSVHFESDTNSACFECNLVLNMIHEESNREIIIIFNGVSGLQLNNFGGGLTQIMGLKLIDLRDQQWSEIKYQINDTENSGISFYCKSMQLAGQTYRT